MTFVLHKSRFWLAHRNGRVCAESDVPQKTGNPYRRGSPSWRAFNESYQARLIEMIYEYGARHGVNWSEAA